METVEFERLTAALRAELEREEKDPFDEADDPLVYGPKERYVGLRDADGRLVAVAGLTTAEVQVGEERFPVVGIGGVIVAAAHRGHGHARTVVGRTLAIAETLGPAFALLFCREDRAGLYARLGFAHVQRTVVVGQPGGCAVMHLCTMWRALHGSARWPEGDVVLQGLPF